LVDKSKTTKRFPNGVSALGKIGANEMTPLLIQLRIVLGGDHALLSADDTPGVLQCIASLLAATSKCLACRFLCGDRDAITGRCYSQLPSRVKTYV
jgi:hypothetical protein